MADLKPFDGALDAPTALQPFSGQLDGEPVKPSGAIRRLADQGIKLAQGVVGLPEAAVGVADLVTGGQAGKLAEKAGVRFKDAKDIMGEYLSPEQKAADAEVQKAEGFLPTLGAMVKNPSTIVGAAAQSAPSMLLGGGVSRGLLAVAPKIGGITAGALGEGLTSAGQNAEQIRQEDPNGTLTGAQSALQAGSGLLTAGISRASGGLANKFGVGDVQTMLATGKLGVVGKEAAQAAAKKGITRKLAEGVINEGVLQELPQSYQEQVAQNLAQGKPWDEGAAAAGAQGMLAGALMGGGANVASHLAEKGTPPLATPEVPTATPPTGPAPQIGNTPDPYISFTDGTVARKSEVDTYINGLPEDQQSAARAKIIGLAPQPADAEQPPADAQQDPGAAPVETIKPSEAMGLDPAAGPMSAAAVIAVDTGAHQSSLDQQASQQAASQQEAPFQPPEGDIAVNDKDKPLTNPIMAAVAAKKMSAATGQPWGVVNYGPRQHGIRQTGEPNGTSPDIPTALAGTPGRGLSEPSPSLAAGVGTAGAAGGTMEPGRAGNTPDGRSVSPAAGVNAKAVTNPVVDSANIEKLATKKVANVPVSQPQGKASEKTTKAEQTTPQRQDAPQATAVDTPDTIYQKALARIQAEYEADPNALRRGAAKNKAKKAYEAALKAQPEVQQAKPSTPPGQQLSVFNGKYGKGMNQSAAKLKAIELNRANTDKSITYAAEEHNDPALENPWAVVGRKLSAQIAKPSSKNPSNPAPDKATRAVAAIEPIAPSGITVSFNGATYPVDSIEDAQAKWNDFRDQARREGGGVRDVGNGVVVKNGSGQQLGSISYNGRFWPTGQADAAMLSIAAPTLNGNLTSSPEEQRKAFAEAEAIRKAPGTPKVEQASAQPAAQAYKPEPRTAVQIARDVGKAEPDANVTDLMEKARQAIRDELGQKTLDSMDQGSLMRSDELTQALHDGQYAAVREYAAAMPVPVHESDIPRETANRAHSGTSYSPEKRGDSARRDYVRTMAAAWKQAERATRGDPEALARVTEVMQDTVDGYRSRYIASLEAHSRVMSSMIAGPANFPVASNRKKSDTADKRAGEADDFLKKGIARMLKAARAPIDNSPDSELARVRANLDSREAQQAQMKEINAAHAKFQRDPASLEKSGLSEQDQKLIREHKPRYSWEPHPYAPYELTNNNSEIRRLRDRLADAEKRVGEAVAGPVETTRQGVRVEENAQDDRLRLFFDGKPSEEIRTDLKNNAFKWSPNAGAWQRQLTDNARAVASRLVDKHFPDSGVAMSRSGSNAASAFSNSAKSRTIESVERITSAIRSKWTNAPEIIVAFDMSDEHIPERVRAEDLRQRSGGAAGTPEGFYYKGKVYLMSSRLATPNDVARVLAHEALGHHGLRGMFGDALKPILQQIATMRKAEVDAKIKEYGLRGVSNLDRLTAAEEVLSEMAQAHPEIGFVKRAIAAIRNWLRANVPGFQSMKMTDADIIEQFILPARAYVERGNTPPPSGSRGRITTQTAFARGDDAVRVGDVFRAPTGEAITALRQKPGGVMEVRIQGNRTRLGDFKNNELKAFDKIGRADYADGTHTTPQSLIDLAKNEPTAPESGGAASIRGQDADPSEAAKVQAGIEGKSLIEAAQFIQRTGSPSQALIAQNVVAKLRQLRAAGAQLQLRVVHRGDMVPDEMIHSRGYTENALDEKGFDIVVWINGKDITSKVGTDYETVLHELVHAATAGSIMYGRAFPDSSMGQSTRDLQDVTVAIHEHINKRFVAADAGNVQLTEFEKDMHAQANNAFRNIDEVVSWALSSKEAQAYLEGIPYKGASLWTRFVQAVRKALGMDASADTALSEVLRIGEAIMNPQDVNNRGFSSFSHKRGIRMSAQQAKGSIVIKGSPVVAPTPTPTDRAFADRADSGIPFSRSLGDTLNAAANEPASPHSWNAPEASKFDDLIYKLQDRQIDTKRVIDSIKLNGTLTDEKNVYLQEELFHGRAAARTEDFVNKELGPLVNMMKMRGIDIPTLDEYLHARHAEEANKLIAGRNPDIQDGGSGMTTQAARDYLGKLTPTERSKLEALAAKVDGILAATRQLYADYNLESQEKVDGWGAMFKHYVPLQREDKDGGMGIGQGFSIKGKEAKGRTGSTRKVVDILANIALQRERAIVRGEKNRVATALVGLVKANPNNDFWQVGPPPAQKVYDPASNSVVDRADPLYKSRENVLVAKIKGKDGNVTEQAVTFNEDNERAARMAVALKNLDAAQLEGMLGVSAKVTRYFAAINTQYNPVFGTVNLVRDVQGALFNLTNTPLKGQTKAIAGDTLSALKGIYLDARAARDGKTPTSKWAALWEEFQNEGGQTGFRDLFANSADRAKAIERELNPSAWMDSPLGKVFTADGTLKVPLAVAQKKATGVFGWLSDYNLAMENAVRLASYKAGIDQGMSKQQAASLAKNLTVNFNRKGQVGQQAGALYAFFNASMQGTARLGQTLFTMEPGKPKTLRLSATGKKIVYGGILLGVAQAVLLSAAGFDDEEPPDFVRERSMIIPTGGKTYITIPMPLGFHVLPNLGRIPAEFVLGGFKDPAKHITALLGLVVGTFNPIGGAGSLVQMFSPTAIDPLVALAENRDWTGKPIAKVSFNKATPGHQLARDTASTPAKLLSEAINFMSGGTDYTAGVMSPTPDQIDYLWGQATGGVGREASKANQMVSSVLSGEELPPHKVPLLGRFYGNADAQSSQSNQFYANINRLNEHEAEIKGRRKDGDAAGAAQYLRDNPDARLFMAGNKAERDVQKLRTMKRELISRGADKAQVTEVDERIKARAAQFNELVKAYALKKAA